MNRDFYEAVLMKRFVRIFCRSMIAALPTVVCASCQNHQPQDQTNLAANNSPARCSVISNEDQARLIEKVSKVEPGMSFDQVRSIMGNPTATAPITNKQADRVYGKSWFYATKLCSSPSEINLIKYDNAYVEMLFHVDGSLFSVVSHGVDGVSHRTNLPKAGSANLH